MTVSAPDYSNKLDDELLALAADSDSLTVEAREALWVELKGRGLNSSTKVSEFVEEQKRLSLTDEVGRLGLSFRGNGRGVYGKFNREISGLNEEYDATVFVVLSYFPVIPTGTYRVFREQGSEDFRFLSKQPLNWVQIVWTWLKSLAVMATVVFAMVSIAEILRHT
jgi:hypothetical protein